MWLSNADVDMRFGENETQRNGVMDIFFIEKDKCLKDVRTLIDKW